MTNQQDARLEEVTTKSRTKGLFLGGAIGDALGARIEFMSDREIRRLVGPRGVTGYLVDAPFDGRAFTDDTQMTLFTAEGLIRARRRLVNTDYNWWSPVRVTAGSYQRWLITQKAAPADPEYRNGWLIDVEGMWRRMAPGNTCLSALRLADSGTIESPINDSKGCGGVMRVAPVGLIPEKIDHFVLGSRLAAITHGHPSGYLAAGALALIIHLVLTGVDLTEAVRSAIDRTEEENGGDEVAAALLKALEFADQGEPSVDAVERHGMGWVAEEALGIAVYCALVADDFQSGVLLAVNHSGDSDSTGSIAGQILGAVLGAGAIPLEWRAELDLGHVVERIADDFYLAYYEEHLFPESVYPPW